MIDYHFVLLTLLFSQSQTFIHGTMNTITLKVFKTSTMQQYYCGTYPYNSHNVNALMSNP